MAELLFTSSLDPIKEGDAFPKGTSLPRHVTVWQDFDLPDSHRDLFMNDVEVAIEGFSPLEILGAEDTKFSPENDTPVRRVIALGSAATLITLHTVLGEIIERHEGIIQNPEWVYERYDPYITYVGGRALHTAEYARLNTVELVEKDTVSKSKIVRKIWELEEA